MRETDCGHIHFNVEDAILHARQNLQCVDSVPVWGTKTGLMANFGRVIGYQSGDHLKRWRLDYDPIKGVHINEEDSTTKPSRKVVHRVPRYIMNGDEVLMIYWRKWTSGHDAPHWLIFPKQD